MVNKFNIIFLAIFGLPLILNGQTEVGNTTNTEIQELINSQKLNLENGGQLNLSAIQQVGNQNESKIFQNQASQQAILATIYQNGSLNSAYIEQTGYSLKSIINQQGNINQSNIWSKGDQISIGTEQQGDRNIINSYIENFGVMSRSVMLRQVGNDNNIELSLVGSSFSSLIGNQPVNISQFGNQNSVSALMENFGNPIDISQTPGVGDQGMSINISNSAFSFPMRR